MSAPALAAGAKSLREGLGARPTPHLHATQGLIGLADGSHRMSACVADKLKH